MLNKLNKARLTDKKINGCGIHDPGCGIHDVGCGIRNQKIIGCGIRKNPLEVFTW